MQKRTQYACLLVVAIAAVAGLIIMYREDAQVLRMDMLARRLAACGSLPNGSVQEVRETQRLFVNIPEDIYRGAPVITPHGATAGYVSNGGLPGQAIGGQGKPDCASYYYDFEGVGTVDLRVPSAVRGLPDYTVKFSVSAP